MKIIITFLISSLFAVALLAQTYSMKVNLTDGTKATIPITEIKKITFSGFTTIENNQRIKNVLKSFILLQNYPNPFNPTTNIQYVLPHSGPVEITIYNISGQKIRQLVFEQQAKGNHTVLWDGKNNSNKPVSSGLYIYQVKFENIILTKKMTFIK